jgi:uncharacterized ferritin-like protein (DUF455 family)
MFSGALRRAIITPKPLPIYPAISRSPSLHSFSRVLMSAVSLDRPSDLLSYGLKALNSHDTKTKVDVTFEAFQLYRDQKLPIFPPESVPLPVPPAVPARPLNLTVLPAGQMPRAKKNDVEGNRIRLIHSLAHIESYAIDIAWDLVLRWAGGARGVKLPKEFFDDWFG